MSQNWNTYKLKEIAQITMGQSPKGVDVNKTGDGIPLLNGPTEFGYSHPAPVQFTDDPKKKAKVGDLLFCVRGSTTGRMNFANQEYAIGRGIGAFRGINGYSTKYVKYLIELYLDNMLNISTGSTFPNLSRTDLENFEIESSDPDTSNAIASILSALDDKIELNLQMNKTLEEMAMTLYKHWFVDFTPLKDGKFVESELGMIPEGWEVKTIGDIGLNYKKNVKKEDINDEDYYLGLEHIEKGNWTISQGGLGADVNSNKARFDKKDILFGKLRPYFKKIGVAPKDGLCSTDIIVLKPKKTLFYGYILCAIYTDEFISYVTNVSSGTRMPRASWSHIDARQIALPINQEIISEFNAIIISFIDQMISNIEENQTLTKTRDTLLPKLISGEVRVKDAENLLNDVL